MFISKEGGPYLQPLVVLYRVLESKALHTKNTLYRQAQDRYSRAGRFLHLPNRSEEIRSAKAQGFSATSDYARISEDMDAIIICVPTPLNEYHEPDLSFITDTTHSIAPHLQRRTIGRA